MPLFVPVLFCAFVVLVVFAAVASYKKNQARLAALQGFALSNGWEYRAADPYDLPERWPGEPFHSGFGRRASNVVTGKVGDRPMIAFDYEYKERSSDGKGRSTTTTYQFAVCALGLPCVLPRLDVGPEGLFSRIGQVLGMQDIELESEDFNRRFRVRCEDPKFATDVLTPRTMELLLRAGKFQFRFAGTDIVSAHRGRLEPADLVNRTAVLAGVVDGVPGFVWNDFGP
ncbi:MAG: hypothetical protein QOE45_561 [Frankiaceae bacterium]|jgi:hypothetical protein|nr:hypothetical protein [Frankiaceae bacterium]